MEEFWAAPPRVQPGAPLGKKFVASLSQIPPIGPVLPTPPIHKPFTVYILRWDSFHGMEEVIGSIPIRSTNHFNHLEAPPFRDFVASLSQIPIPLL